MGAILKVNKLTTFAEAVIVVLIVGLICGGVYWFAPGLRVTASKQLEALQLNGDKLDNVTNSAKLPLPSSTPSTKVASKPLNRIAEYAWNGNSGMIAANGGPRTTEGSLMEAAGVNLEIVRLDGVTDLRNMMISFCDGLANGEANPTNEKSAFAVSIMGDGVPFFITTTQNALDAKFGKDKFHVQYVAPIGLSYGEDKVIGPKKWKDDPQSMRGAVISAVIGDGDWVVAVNYASANKVSVNPDPTTYDPDALNFVPAPNDDYTEAVKDLIKSQKTGYTISLKEVKNGKLTGKVVDRKIDGAATWAPADRTAFENLVGFTDVVSTKDFVNQMATSIIVVKEWAMQNEKTVVSMLKQTYIANNQIKQYDEWLVRASECVAKTYNQENGKFWYTLFKGQTSTPEQTRNNGGLEYHVGGTRVFSYADAMQYFGITDGNNRYKAVYNQVSSYLTDLNPNGFNESAKDGVVVYENAVNLYFLKSISDIDAGSAVKQDYSQTKTEVMASGHWNINFATGSSAIQGSEKDLETIYNLLIQAEETKLEVVGYTDNVGNPSSNLTLSRGRANAVVDYLKGRGISSNRFQLIDGRGDSNPIGDNNTNSGRALNRRVDITLLK